MQRARTLVKAGHLPRLDRGCSFRVDGDDLGGVSGGLGAAFAGEGGNDFCG